MNVDHDVLKNSTDTYKFPSANAVEPPKLASVAERFATLKKKPIEPELFSKQLASNINEVIGREILTETHISPTRGRPVDARAELCHLRYYIFTVGSKTENLKKEIKVGGWTLYIGAEEPLTDLDEAFQDALLSIGTRNGSQISTTLGEIVAFAGRVQKPQQRQQVKDLITKHRRTLIDATRSGIDGTEESYSFSLISHSEIPSSISKNQTIVVNASLESIAPFSRDGHDYDPTIWNRVTMRDSRLMYKYLCLRTKRRYTHGELVAEVGLSSRTFKHDWFPRFSDEMASVGYIVVKVQKHYWFRERG